jgi:hypothetical protein
VAEVVEALERSLDAKLEPWHWELGGNSMETAWKQHLKV